MIFDSNFVFEEIVPRFADVNNDDFPELICILTNIYKGASVAVFEANNNGIQLIAQSEFIGRSNRWLNIAAVEDLDYNGSVEICWVETPHIGGTLIIGQIVRDEIINIDSFSGLSNHQIGSRNLDLSVVQKTDTIVKLWLPVNNFSMVVGFSYRNGKLEAIDSIMKSIDPLVWLS